MNKNPPPSFPAPSDSARWRIARRLLVALAALATFLAVFYTVENWRGKRAWDNCRRQLEAKGEVLDWNAYIPAPVPDDQNFYKAPHMREWFVRDSFFIQPAGAPGPFVVAPGKETGLLLAEVRVAPANATVADESADATLRFDDPSAREEAAKLLRETLGPCAIGGRQCVLIGKPVDQVKPLRLVLLAHTVPTAGELAEFFPGNPVNCLALAYTDTRYVQIQPAGSNAFRLSLKAPVYGAADYLARTDPLMADFDLLRRACERPYARIDCDYQQPFAISLPNFVTIRNAAQILSQRAQSCLLLGQPEAAWHQLELVGDFCQILQAKPAGKPLTLVGAMIRVAVAGLYVDIVEDGLRLHAWREPELAALDRQLESIDLVAPVVQAFREERAATSRAFDSTKRGELVKLLNPSGRRSRLALSLMPRGWFYQNMAQGAETEQKLLDSLGGTNSLIRPGPTSDYFRLTQAKLGRWSPYTFLVAMATPNFLRAVQTVARNQTLVNQARLACGFERYRFVQGRYPEQPDALVPRFLARLPHDLINGQPMNYRLLDGGGYLLYSVGWDEKDDGGVPGKSREEGDWVWQMR